MPEEAKELRLEDLTDQSTFTYIKTFLEEAVLDQSPELVRSAIDNLKDIGEHISGNPRVLGGYEKFRRLYLTLQTEEGSVQEAFVSQVPEKYQDASSHDFTLNGPSNPQTQQPLNLNTNNQYQPYGS